MTLGQLAIALAVVFAVNLLPALVLLLGGFKPGDTPRGRLWGSPDGRAGADS